MAKVYLQLGTNLGDKQANIERALKLLDATIGLREKTSQIIGTQALGFEGPAFANCIARYRTRRRPLTILRLCKEIEHSMGRLDAPEYAPDGSRVYHNRIIDIDILQYYPTAKTKQELTINTKELLLPHPQIESRPFVKPLLQQVLE